MADSTLLPPQDGKRAQLKAANREAILQAARRVFAISGYEATTVRDIIRATDLAAGTFYNYFKSKEEIFKALADDSAADFRPRLKTVRTTATDFPSFIQGAYRAYFQFLDEENHAAIHDGAPHMSLIGVRVDTPEMYAVFEEIRLDIESMLKQEDASRVDTEYLAAAAIGIARNIGDHMLQRRPVDVETATHFATSLLLKGIDGLLTTS